MKRNLLLFIMIFPLTSFAQISNFELFPSVKLFKPYYADAIAPQFSLSKHLETTDWYGNIGNVFTLAGADIYSVPVQISAAATAFSTVIKTPGHIQVYTIDYLVEFYSDFRFEQNTTLRFILGHLSAHYADDGIIELNNYPINYVRDYAGLHLQYIPSIINGRIYAGFNYNFHNEPVDKQYLIQTGAEGSYTLSSVIAAYAALDLKFKSEVNYGSTQSYQVGFRFTGVSNISLRLAYTHRRGYEERGQLYNLKDVKNTIGFYFDF